MVILMIITMATIIIITIMIITMIVITIVIIIIIIIIIITVIIWLLGLRRYDTIKTCRWNFFKFFWIVHYRKIVKIRFKNRESPCYFLSSRGQKIKNITKIEQKRLFLFTFLVSFFMAFLAQKLIYTINIWFNFVFGSFFEQDHLLNLFISGVYAKRWPNCTRISIQKLI